MLKINIRFKSFKNLRKLSYRWLIVIGLVILSLLGGLVWFQTARATNQVHTAQQQDTAGKLSEAKKTLNGISTLLVLPHTQRSVRDEQHRNQVLTDNQHTIERAKQLLKENKTDEALKLLNGLQKDPNKATSDQTQQQVATLKQQAGQQTGGTSHGSSGGSTSQPSGGGSTGGGTTGGGGSSPPPPPPPGPLTAISVTSFSVTPSPRTASSCMIGVSVSFSTNGSGTVNVTWQRLSTKTSSGINNPVAHTFSGAGTQTDSENDIMQGLEPGDSYRVSAILASQTNPAITTTAGPITVSNCAAPQALLPAQEPSYLTQITPGSLSASSMPDNLFPNECSLTITAPFSVDAAGSVQVVYTLTSGASIGATLYAGSVHNFTSQGPATDTGYIRMPHLPGGGGYSILATFIDSGDHSITATATTTVSCP
jgi:hypothetical protein